MLLSRQDILAAPPGPFEDVAVPEWGGTVRVRAMSGEERESFIAEIEGENVPCVPERLLVRSLAGEDGVRLFADGQFAELAKASSVVLDRLASVAKRVNGLGDGAVIDAAKN